MTGYLLDTNVISELRKHDRANDGVKKWFAEHTNDDLWISVLAIAELERGVTLLDRRDPTSARLLAQWLNGLTTDFSDRILPIGLNTAKRWATIGIPDPLPIIDGLLAATAIEHGLTIVTRNLKHIEPSGAATENPFT